MGGRHSGRLAIEEMDMSTNTCSTGCGQTRIGPFLTSSYREDLKVKEPDLALCSHEALKNNLNLKMGEFKVCQMEQDYQV